MEARAQAQAPFLARFGVKVFAVRHADAGEREKWTGRDELRPLSEKGWRQAQGLAKQLAPAGVGHILTSPYVRCRQTVEPLAQALGLPIRETAELAEGGDFRRALELAEKQEGGGVVICSHGDVIGDLVESLEDQGLVAGSARFPKGSTWVLELVGGKVKGAKFISAAK
jgi:phosphohistidine phosphatase SixA